MYQVLTLRDINGLEVKLSNLVVFKYLYEAALLDSLVFLIKREMRNNSEA